jgi:hypothetical protein
MTCTDCDNELTADEAAAYHFVSVPGTEYRRRVYESVCDDCWWGRVKLRTKTQPCPPPEECTT